MLISELIRNYAETNNSMIKQHLHLDGDSLVSVFIRRGTIEESEKFFDAVSSKLMDNQYPDLVGHLEKIKAHDQIHKCTTIEELEALKFDLTPVDMFEKLADALDALEELTDLERAFVFARVGDILVQAPYNHVQQYMQQRAQMIAREKKTTKRIITQL